ncbi:hypothetical protein [Pyrobaculum ferrireducens]|uniref:Phosphoesterase, DHHA1 n=1 Tax=Pyrobaculum ferrireducens TaxID=1104324 RepID=G7VDJ6_9CREN|nr:hypothetical protein [Pyrobaculum ferrireducens]AET33975.1 hypothetical protein P186_2591 [Pyrobaculum ferrireducens]
MSWLDDVLKASRLIKSGGFVAVTHGGTAHADDTVAAALLKRHGAEAVYRLNTVDEILEVGGGVVLADIGDAFRGKLPERYAVLDHHGVSDPSEEPSSVVQVMYAVGARPAPLVATLIHFLDLFDRYGPGAKRWAGPYGNSLNNGLTKYFSDFHGVVKDEKFLDLVAEAVYARLEVDLPAFHEAFKLAERLPYADAAERFPRTFQNLRLMLSAARDPVAAAATKEAYETGFGVDFGAYAVLAVPELEPYVLKGLEKYFGDAAKAVELVTSGRYSLLRGDAAVAVAVEDNIPPAPLWNALLDTGVLSNEPAIIVVRDRRTKGAYTVWRPDRYASVIDLRRLKGDAVVFKHVTGFMAVVKASTAEEAAEYALRQL